LRWVWGGGEGARLWLRMSSWSYDRGWGVIQRNFRGLWFGQVRMGLLVGTPGGWRWSPDDVGGGWERGLYVRGGKERGRVRWGCRGPAGRDAAREWGGGGVDCSLVGTRWAERRAEEVVLWWWAERQGG